MIQNFIRPIYDKFMGGNGSGYGDFDDYENMEDDEICKYAILIMCDINSRVELDHDKVAEEKFLRLIREPYAALLKRNDREK